MALEQPAGQATQTNAVPPLTVARKLGYGAGDVGPALVATISGFFLNVFLLDVAGLEPYMAAAIFLIVKIWDSLNDPIIGAMTDRTNTRWGRRRPWLLFGAIPFGIAWLLQWLVPDLGGWALFAYYLVVALLLDTAVTSVNVPYTALTPEIAPGYNERTDLNTYRFSFSILGGMFSLLIHDTILRSAATLAAGYAISAAIMGAVIIVTNWITFASVQERYVPVEQADEPGFIEGFKIAFSNRPFLMVTGIYLMSWLAIQFIQANMLFYVRYWMGAEDQFIILAMALQISIFLFLLVWSKVSEKIGKRHAYFAGISIWILVEVALYFVQPGQMTLLIVLAVLAGAGASVAYLIPWSMLPDVVDVDELNTGLRREGVYYGFFVFLQKLGISLGLALSNLVLQWVNYIAAVPGEPIPVQNDGVLLAFRLFVSFVPLVILLLSLPIAYKYPITRERHAEIQAALAERRGGLVHEQG
ncbi:MAG: MFS transporter [Anaerolineales bacterium]|nr:MFS transporter [Anaerolineales bacterium]